MLKTIFKNLLLIALPLGLAVGCAENRPQTQASYSSDPSEMLTPTSAQPGQRVYTDTETPSGAAVTPAPSGATPANWAIAQEIQDRLLSDPTLAPMGSSLAATVDNDGVVTLRGTVGSDSEQKRVCDIVSGLPGVRSVNNQMNGGRTLNNGNLNMQGPGTENQ
jgi:hypothetical protein